MACFVSGELGCSCLVLVPTIDHYLPSGKAAGTVEATKKRVSCLLMVLVVCAGVRIWLIANTEVIARDGVVYVKMAREWSADASHVVQSYDYHVGYPVAIAGTHRILEALGQARYTSSWDLSGQIVSLVASLLTMVGVWWLAGMAFDWRIAWLSALLFGVGRKWAALGADVLSDALAVCLQIWAVVLALLLLRQLRQKSNWAILLAAGVGICSGLGYLVRPEALLILILAVAFWLICQFYWRASWRLTFACIGVALLGALACAGPYMIAIGALSKKKSVDQIIMAPARQFDSFAWLAGLLPGQRPAIRVFVNQFFEALHPAVALFLCIWLAVWICKKVLRVQLPSKLLIFPRRVNALFMLTASGAIMLMLTGLYHNVHYMSERHVMFLAALLSPLAGAGFMISVESAGIIVRRLKLPQWFARLILPVGTTAIVLGLLSHTLGPLHAGKAYYKQAGRFVGEVSTRGDYVLADRSRIVHYAVAANPDIGAPLIPTGHLSREQLLGHIRQTSATYLVISDDTLAQSTSRLVSLLKTQTFIEIRQFDQLVKNRSDTLRVYRIDHRVLPSTP